MPWFDILVVGNEEFHESLKPYLARSDYRLRVAGTYELTLQCLEAQRPEFVVLQFQQAGWDPYQILHELIARSHLGELVVLADDPPVEEIVKCMRLGVRDFLQYPNDLQKLSDIAGNVYTRGQNQLTGAPAQKASGFESIIGECPQIQEVLKLLKRITQRRWVTVLILGETGTGKEVFARAIHFASEAASGENFVEINCAAIPEKLLEAELFGYERGAFTDAKTRKQGLFEIAEGGSLFLDEIGDMDLSLQAKLLKVIESKCFRRLGGVTDIQIKTRIIAGTNAELRNAVEHGRFRSDLYYRLNVVSLSLPPLRERGDDVLLLAKFFLQKYAGEFGSTVRNFSPAALEILMSYHWPGNVRELRHAIERAVLLGEAESIAAEELLSALGINPPPAFLPPSTFEHSDRPAIEIPANGLSLKDGERQLIDCVLNLTKWNKTKAAQILAISRPRLQRKIDEYQLH
ncbi:MAG: sigma-54 dependent transcriptional regulator [candidate division KSB1 bacterium]